MPDPIAKQLNDARVRLTNAQTDPDLQAKLAPRGYTPEALDAGLALHAAAQEAQNKAARERGEQKAATDALAEAHEAADQVYDDHFDYACVLFRDDRDARTALGLDGRRKRPTAGWLRQAGQFYANALAEPRYVAAFEGIGIPPATLEAGQALVEAVAKADEAQEREKGDAQDATPKRDAALEALDTYMDRFLGLARVALRGDPQLLEKLMIVAPSGRGS